MTKIPAALHYGMKLKIGVMSRTWGDLSRVLLQKAYEEDPLKYMTRAV